MTGTDMRLRLPTLFIALLAISGCDQQSNPDSSTNDKTSDEQGPAANEEEKDPVFQAEIFLESRSADKGVINFSLRLEETEKRDGEDEAGKSWSDFKLQGGSVCKINPTFIEHRDGQDVWQIGLKYVAGKESDATPRAAVSKEVLFDGKQSVVVTEDAEHSIVVRPRSENGS